MIRTTFTLDNRCLDIINGFVGHRNKSRFIRMCINYWFTTSSAEDKEKYRDKIAELAAIEDMRDLVSKETAYRNAYKCIRRSGFFLDGLKGQLENDYPKGILPEEKAAIYAILKLRDDIAKELVKRLPEHIKGVKT